MNRHFRSLVLCLSLLPLPAATADDTPAKGLRVYTAGHSFHVFVSPLLTEIAKESEVKDHRNAGMHFIGGSQVIQHWNLSDAKNKAKELLGKGEIDVLTLSPVLLPDEGIEKFVMLGLKHNKDLRITVQANWLPWDVYDPRLPLFPRPVDFDTATAASLKKIHTPYFESIDKKVAELNKTAGKQAVLVAPIGQAVIALRAKVIAGQAPGVKKQSELFADPMGHPRIHIQLLNAYCHYAIIYQRSPVGLPAPPSLTKAKVAEAERLNTLLQEIAWETVKGHPLSGVK
jgi:hypothetical protein